MTQELTQEREKRRLQGGHPVLGGARLQTGGLRGMFCKAWAVGKGWSGDGQLGVGCPQRGSTGPLSAPGEDRQVPSGAAVNFSEGEFSKE